jgi:uncharacterized protein (DUF58 family)
MLKSPLQSMQPLIPQSASARATPTGKAGRIFGFGLTRLSLALFASGFVLAIPAFFHARDIGLMLAWDGMIAGVVVIDALRLPRPESFRVTRRFIDAPQLGRPTRVSLEVSMDARSVTDVELIDDLHPTLIAMPEVQRLQLLPHEVAVTLSTIYPGERGDFNLGRVYLRYRGAFDLAERWACADPVHASGNTSEDARKQRVRVFPAHGDSHQNTQFYLLRARQIEMQKRKLRLRGVGREFDSMRDYQSGDELRKISWTATARRGRLVTRQFSVERSQQVWVLLDAGRLSRTAFELRRSSAEVSESSAEREAAHLFTVTQLDLATTAATMLAQVIQSSGDKFGMMAYGREVQQLLLPGAGAMHLRLLLDLLSQAKSEAAEADHLHAAARLKNAQRRRGLIVWITELTDSVGRPELLAAAAEMARRHLVVIVLLKHPELEALSERQPTSREEMFHAAAAQEMLERRRQLIAQLEQQGVLILETSAAEAGINAVSKYLEVKAEGLL